jgi:cation transport regulator
MKMPYDKTSELPDSVRNNLPEKAQEIYMNAFNNAWDQYKDPGERKGNASREETAHKVAWSAVKQEYEKNEDTGKWEKQ